MLAKHWRIFNVRRKQIGLCRTLQFTSLKILRRLLQRGVQFHFGMTAEDVVLQFLIERYLGKRKITYVDVGCHEARRISNTYLLYLNGNTGLAIDLNPKYASEFMRERPNDIFVCAALSDGVQSAVVHEFTDPEVNTIDQARAKRWKSKFKPTGSRTVETTTLEAVLTRHLSVATIDVLLLDVEGHELNVLRGASLPAIRPALVVCELHDLDLRYMDGNPVIGFMEANSYSLVAYATDSGYFVREDLLKEER
jgi:FkbM family methyltransferase